MFKHNIGGSSKGAKRIPMIHEPSENMSRFSVGHPRPAASSAVRFLVSRIRVGPSVVLVYPEMEIKKPLDKIRQAQQTTFKNAKTIYTATQFNNSIKAPRRNIKCVAPAIRFCHLSWHRNSHCLSPFWISSKNL